MRTHDFVAVGVGPFNLGLACLTEPIADLDGVFLDRGDGFSWHPGMLLPSSTLQTPFLADLVTLADPTSPYSFLNFLKESGRLYPFYIRENFFPLRVEFDEYCRWAAAKLPSVHFGREVTAVDYDESEECYVVRARHTASGQQRTYRGRHLVLGTGTPPHVPEACAGLLPAASRTMVHSCGYLDAKPELQRGGSVTVLGSGQSAAEIYHDLLADSERHGYQLNWVTRSARFFPLEYTKLTLEMTSPDYCDYFHALPGPTRDELLAGQQGLYKGIDSALINRIYDLLYERHLRAAPRTRLIAGAELTGVEEHSPTGPYTLRLRHREQGSRSAIDTDRLVLATGYQHSVPEFLHGVTDRIATDESGRFAVGRNHSVDHAGKEIFVQNAEIHTHGIVAPDLGMGAHRNSRIIRELSGKEHYPIERSIAFQEFGAQPVTGR